ncbi:MAG TPA: SPOR domain-containing protein [Gemmatimonadaceae bacterium]|nr:SPOR domain-containing protein [Gemmatimonadaceae bacterium]
MQRWIVLSSMLVVSATGLDAQASARPIDPVFTRAQALVSDGNGAAGRALIDSMIAATPSSAPLYPQALFWRASLAASAADAESDYRHIVVDYPLAPQAEDALLRLAQLELARGDRDGALVHLRRIQRDYPHSKSLGRASYWTARVLFEKNDIPAACAANAAALSQSDPAEVELRNQIQYQGQRCPAVATANVTATAQPTEPAPVAAAAPKAASSTAVPVPAGESAQRPLPSSVANDVKPSIVDPAKVPQPERPAAAVDIAPATPAATPAVEAIYSVQVAAYSHKTDAEKLASTLSNRGYAARVDGMVAPFRVRIGRYATNGEAEEALKKIKAKHMDGFVARVTER